jgi:hypothetical protein
MCTASSRTPREEGTSPNTAARPLLPCWRWGPPEHRHSPRPTSSSSALILQWLVRHNHPSCLICTIWLEPYWTGGSSLSILPRIFLFFLAAKSEPITASSNMPRMFFLFPTDRSVLLKLASSWKRKSFKIPNP